MMNVRSPHDQYRSTIPYYYRDEISLIDLWLVLTRRRKLLLGIFVSILAIGCITAIVLPDRYTYSTSIEIGSRLINNAIRPIEDPLTLLAKIRESYIPLIQHRYRKQNLEDNTIYRIEARIPKGSQLVVLESKGRENFGNIYQILQEWVVDEVKKDHKRILDVIRKELEISLNQARNKLAEIKDKARFFSSREKRLVKITELIKKQISDAKSDLSSTEASRKRAIREANSAANSMTLLMLDNEIQQQRERVANLEERLILEVAEGQDELAKLISDNLRDLQNQQDYISRIESQIENLVETRSLVPPLRSMEPTSVGGRMIFLLSILLGIVSSIFTVFFAEFVHKAKIQSLVNAEHIDEGNELTHHKLSNKVA